MYLINGKYKGFWKPGEDISYFLCANRIIHYETEEETLVNAKNFFQEVQSYFQSDREVMEQLKETILGEAYYNACLKAGDGEINVIPDAKMWFEELRNLILNYTEKGFLFNERPELTSAIFKEKSEEKHEKQTYR